MPSADKVKDSTIVIGAGIVGVSCALHLQRLGHDVVLMDRDDPGQGTSFGNAGVLARSSVVPIPTPGIIWKSPGMLFGRDGPLFLKFGYLPKLIPWLIPYLRSSKLAAVEHISKHLAPLVSDSVDEHLTLAKGTKAERWIKQSPYLFAYLNEAAYEADKLGWRLRTEAGFPGEPLRGKALRDFEPALSDAYQFAVALADHGFISNPGRYVYDLAQAFIGDGGRFVKTDVTDINIADDGPVVETGDGAFACKVAVLATGVWSGELAKKLGSTVGLESERGYHIALEGATPQPSMPILDTGRRFVATPMDGALRCAGIVEFGGLDAGPSNKALDLLLRGAHALFPGLTYKSKQEWLGHRPAPTDSLPILGQSPKNSDIYFAYGHHHVGLTSGPKSGRVVAQQIAGLNPNIDMSVYRADRAARGH